MNIFKALFGASEETPEEKQKADESRRFDMFKYDGVRAAKMGQPDYAVKCYREALSIHEDLEVRDYLAQALIRTGALDEAREQLDVLAGAEPDNVAIMIMTAQVAYLQEDYEAMAAACERALQAAGDKQAGDNELARLHYLYGQAYIGQGNTIGAIAMLTKAVVLNPDMGDARLLRGQTLLRMGDVAGAEADADSLAETAPDNEDVLLLKARVEHARGNADAALDVYNKVTELNPFCADAFRERGAIRYEKGDMRGAQADMQTVLELEPEKVADINGEFSAEGIEQKTRQAYSNINPMGL